MCASTQGPAIHVLPPFMFWTPPPLLPPSDPLCYYKRRLKSKGEERGEKRRGIKKKIKLEREGERERRTERNAGLASGGVL